jgi:hypothetical protein
VSRGCLEENREREREAERQRRRRLREENGGGYFLQGGGVIRRPWAVLLEEFLAFSLCLGKLALFQERLACAEKVLGRVLEGRDGKARQMLLVHEHL